MEKAIEIKRRAQRCVQNGDLDGALREYEKLVGTPESDPYNFVLLADLLYKKGEQGRAAERYLSGVTAYEKAGLYKNAIAVCKKMMRLSLSQTLVLKHLAELHALDGLSSEASVYFRQYADLMTRVNRNEEAIEALRMAFDNGQEDPKVLEEMAELLVLGSQNAKAAEALREAQGHWQARGQAADARRCAERAHRLDPSAAAPAAGAGTAPGAAIPTLRVPSAPVAAPDAPGADGTIEPDAAGPPRFDVSHVPEPGMLEVERTIPVAPPRLELTPSLPAEDAAPAEAPPAPAPPPAESGGFERSPRFVAPPSLRTPAAAAAVPPPAAGEPEPAPEPAGHEEGVYEIAPAAEASYEHALDEAEHAPPAGHAGAGGMDDASGHALGGVAKVEQLLQRAQDEFRAGDREKASRALMEAAVAYEGLGRLDSAATIFRSLGRGAQSPLEVMQLWLANCEKRGDRAEGSQVACELGDRALSDGQEAQARHWFEHASKIDPANETARRRLQRMNGTGPGKAKLAPAPPVAPAPQTPEGGRVEVALGRGQAVTFDLNGLLQEFRRGVESQLEGDAQGHYDLGMAYREMGLHEQAIESFRVAQFDARLSGRAHEMIGRCHADGGAHDEAVPEFEAALEAGALDGAGEAELRYHLALSLAALGDLAAAVHQLEIADQRFPGRSDVAERLAEWRRAFGQAA